jgi:hypothetical protein
MPDIISRHERLGYIPNPDCTIFNYDLIILLTDNGPLLYLYSMGGYIGPELGGQIERFDFNELLKCIDEQKPHTLIIPEAYVNNSYPNFKKFFEGPIKERGFYGNKLLVYNQKEQNFYYKEIHTDPDWFWNERENYNSNVIYHSIGFPTPVEEPDHSYFKQLRFCKQGFACESFRKLYYLKDVLPSDMFEQRMKLNLKNNRLIFYGSTTTSIRGFVKSSLQDSKLDFITCKYGNENLFDVICNDNKGIGISMDGLVFNTIRDAEFGVYGLPSIKVTRVDDFLLKENNLSMFDTRSIIQIQRDVFEHADHNEIRKHIEEGYEKYMEGMFNDESKFYKTIRYHFFIVLLQKFNNIELFIFDILFGDKIKDFIEQLPMNVDFSIFDHAARPQYIESNNFDEMKVDYINQLINEFSKYFYKLYGDWINNNNDNV